MARPIAKDYADKREHIRTGAAKLFADQGFDRASMSAVAQACGISKANIYHYYNSKSELLFDLLDHHLSDLRNVVQAAARTQATPEQRLRNMVAAILIAYQGADNEHKVQLSAMGNLSDHHQRVLRGYQRDMVTALSASLNEISPDTFSDNPSKLRATTMSVFGMLNWHYMWNAKATSYEREDYASLVCDLTLSGLKGI